MSITKAMNMLLQPLGRKTRAFAIDYQDSRGTDYNTEICCLPNMNYSDLEIVSGIVQDFESRGYRVTVIHEMLDGYDKEKLERMTNENPKEAIKHIRLLYLDE